MRYLILLLAFPMAVLAQPVVFPGQTRNVLTSTPVGTSVGDPIFAAGDPDAWSITLEDNGNPPPAGIDQFERFFDIENDGQLKVLQSLDRFSVELARVQQVEITLDLRAFNDIGFGDGTVTVFIVDDGGSCAQIPASQTRFVNAAANPPENIGDPIDTHGFDSIWIEDAFVMDGVVLGDDFVTAFVVESPPPTASNFAQLQVNRPLATFFPVDQITRILIRLRGHSSLAGCPAFAEGDVILYVLPADAGGDIPGGPDLSSLISDFALRSCIRDSLGLVGSQPITAADILGLTHLDCLCRGDDPITDLDGLHLFSNLQFLNLSNNLIQDIRNVTGLTDLEDLRLAGNLIIDITTSNPLASLVNLKTIDLSFNQIVDSNAFSTLANIEFISLADNEICDIESLAANPNIGDGDTILLDNNHLTSAQALADIGTIQSRNPTLLTFSGQTTCPNPPFTPLILENWPQYSVVDFTIEFINRGNMCNFPP